MSSKNKNEYEMDQSRALESFTDENSGIFLCQWNDTSAIVVGSNCYIAQPFEGLSRWSAKDLQ